MKPSGIGGQAVIEGIMMRNKSQYSIAVRKPDNEIEVITKENSLLTEKHKFLNLPIIRGIFNFIDSLVVGMSTITYSASFYEDPSEQKSTPVDDIAKAVFKDKLDAVLMAVTVLISIVFAVFLFMLAPYFISRLLSKYIVSKWVLNLIEGLLRVVIFIAYILIISLMKDIKRVFMYHGAEHKCINCIENGLELNVNNVRISSRYHKRCGTSFLFFVMFISVVFFIFIRVNNPFWQIGVRLLLVPIIAGVSYEIIKWAGKSDNPAVVIISKPGMWLQGLTTREPDDDMIQVAIKAVEAVFDWKKFLAEYYETVEDAQIGSASPVDVTIAQTIQQQATTSEELESEEPESTEEMESIYQSEPIEQLESAEQLESIEKVDSTADMYDDSEEIYGTSYDEVEDHLIQPIDMDHDTATVAGFEMYDENDDEFVAIPDSLAEEEDDDSYGIEYPEDNDAEDDGIQFIDEIEDEEDDYAVELPIFKQRKTDL